MCKFHRLKEQVAEEILPRRFTYPFCYTPHPLCVKAAEDVQDYLTQLAMVQETGAQKQGQMFGVLLVRNREGEIGYLAAFSGLLDGKTVCHYFVTPIYDLQAPDGFFQQEEAEISAINNHIRAIQESPRYKQAQLCYQAQQSAAVTEVEAFRQQMKQAKTKREAFRSLHPDAPQDDLIRESQFQKAELKRLRNRWEERIAACRQLVDVFEQEISQLQAERKRRSIDLQMRLFSHYIVRNARGEERDLCTLFRETPQGIPPAGAGECAAPKLLQYAYLHGYEPLAMAEFWWGASPRQELRREGCYYPACKGKCEPILRFMLEGLEVEDNPLKRQADKTVSLEIVYEDQWLVVVNKPAGLLSVEGKGDGYSVVCWAKEHYPEADGPLVVHRLDMATSGLLLIAKTKAVHQHLQAQFKHHAIRKRYVALLAGELEQKQGAVSLPLRPDPDDRPRQVVDLNWKKPAITRYEVVSIVSGQTRVYFYPETGRTHQLRVHAAHPSGLNCPILGDPLYGHAADRLYLHAEQLTFLHPVTLQTITVERKADF